MIHALKYFAGGRVMQLRVSTKGQANWEKSKSAYGE
jgi:hypothetical protein